VVMAMGVWLVCTQVAVPVRLWAGQAEQNKKINALIAQLKGNDPNAAHAAYRELLKCGAPAATKLLPLLRHPKPEVKGNVASLLRRLAGNDSAARDALTPACPTLVAALGDEATSHPVAVVLTTIGQPAVKHLIPALRHGNKRVRIGAATALAGVFASSHVPPASSAPAIAPLTALTKDDEFSARAYAYVALAAIDSSRRVEILLQALADPHPYVGFLAAGYIADHAHEPQLKDKRLVAALTAAGKSPDRHLKQAAARALQRLQGPKAAEDAPRRGHARPPAGAAPVADPRTAALLSRTIPELKLTRTKLQDVLQFVGEYSDLSMVTDWRALEKFGIASSTTVTLSARNVRVSEALRLILTDVAKGQGKLGFGGVSGLVVISTTEGLAALRKARQFEQARRRLAGAADSAVWKKLDTPLPLPKVDFRDVPLKDALAYFRELSGVRFALDWEALGELGAHESSRVTLKLRSATIATVLWVMLLDFDKARGLAVIVNNGTVTLAKPSRVSPASPAGTPRPTTTPTNPPSPKPPADAETVAASKLRLAGLYREAKKTDRAIGIYQKIVKEYPNTKAATVAKQHLDTLKNR